MPDESELLPERTGRGGSALAAKEPGDYSPIDPAADAICRGSQSAKIHTQRAHWLSVRLRQEFVDPARRWWPSAQPSMGSLPAFTAGTGTGVSDCVLGSTARDISGSNPSRSASPQCKVQLFQSIRQVFARRPTLGPISDVRRITVCVFGLFRKRSMCGAAVSKSQSFPLKA